ncbi:MAG: hypothetical protein HN337_03805 [Deltaproteobacteria bacterium]|nr:hypothetical protein [Deltaproteobacteria bacterium]
MIWFAALALIAIGTGAAGCNRNKGNGGGDVDLDGGLDADGGVDLSDGGVDLSDGGVDADAGVPLPPGCNTQFFKPGCKITDIDAYGKTVAVVCSDLVPGDNNKKFFLGEVADPMQPHNFTRFNATLDALSATYSGDQTGMFSVVPQQIQRGAVGLYDGEYYSIFAGVGPTCLSGITFNIDGSKYTSTLDDYVYPALSQEYPQVNYWRPCEVGSSLITQNAGGYKMWFPASVESTQNKLGILRVYDLPPDTPYEFFDKDGNHEIILLSGEEPTAIAKVPTAFYDPVNTDYNFAAVLNSKGFGVVAPSYGMANASIDVVRLNHREPHIAVEATIDLGASQVFPMKELPITADGRYVVVIGSINNSLALMVVDMQSAAVVGTLEDSALDMNAVSDVVVRGSTAYIATNGEIRMYDISNPASPIRKEQGGQEILPIPVGAGLSDITVDEDGIIYAVTDDPDDTAGDDSAVYAIDPQILTDRGCQ